MTTPKIDGPRLAPRNGPARQLVVFLHGYGADGNDLLALGRQWQALLPDAEFISPNAPQPCDNAPGRFQWFALARIDPNETQRGTEAAAPALEAFLDQELKRLNLTPDKLAHDGASRRLAPQDTPGCHYWLFGNGGRAGAVTQIRQWGPSNLSAAWRSG